MKNIFFTINSKRITCTILYIFLIGLLSFSCTGKPKMEEDLNLSKLGSIEVTAQLVEIPEKFPDIPLYDYAFVLKYKVLKIHRGEIGLDIIYVGQYNPLKPRSDVADARVGDIGGNLKKIRAGETHRMALEVPIEDHYMGGIINKYFEEDTGAVYWALWTNKAYRENE